jgi:hypothetical protein
MAARAASPLGDGETLDIDSSFSSEAGDDDSSPPSPCNTPDLDRGVPPPPAAAAAAAATAPPPPAAEVSGVHTGLVFKPKVVIHGNYNSVTFNVHKGANAPRFELLARSGGGPTVSADVPATTRVVDVLQGCRGDIMSPPSAAEGGPAPRKQVNAFELMRAPASKTEKTKVRAAPTPARGRPHRSPGGCRSDPGHPPLPWPSLASPVSTDPTRPHTAEGDCQVPHQAGGATTTTSARGCGSSSSPCPRRDAASPAVDAVTAIGTTAGGGVDADGVGDAGSAAAQTCGGATHAANADEASEPASVRDGGSAGGGAAAPAAGPARRQESPPPEPTRGAPSAPRDGTAKSSKRKATRAVGAAKARRVSSDDAGCAYGKQCKASGGGRGTDTVGCTNRGCTARIHHFCFIEYCGEPAEGSPGARLCPKCAAAR